MLFKHFYDLVDIRLGFGILCLHGLDLVGRLLKDPEDATLLLVFVKPFQFRNDVAQQAAHLAQVFGAHIVQRIL